MVGPGVAGYRTGEVKGKGYFAGGAEYWTDECLGCFSSLLSVVSCK